MSWNALSVVVVAVFALQGIVLATLVLALLKVKGTALGWTQGFVLPLVAGGRRLAALAARVGPALWAQVQAIQTKSRAIRQHCQLAPPPAGMWVHPRNVQQALSLATSLRARIRAPRTPNKPNKTLRLAERLGLVPPILRKLAPLGKVAKTALQTVQRLKG